MCRLLNGLHRLRACLNTSLFFEEGGIHSLRPAWISRVPIVVENNMSKGNWFTPNPYFAEAGISSSKWLTHWRGFPLMKDEAWAQSVNELEPIFRKKKWKNNAIYELIMLLKVVVVAKPKLLITAFLFWNSGTNTFDFKMGPMFPTILDMAQVFKLRPSDRVVDITHEWSSSSYPTVEGSDVSDSITLLEYNLSAFKSYRNLFTGFILFSKKSFGPTSSTANRDQEHMYFLLYWLNK